MKNKILLVVPPEKEVVDLKQTGSKWPRIGIAYIAANLRKNNVEVIVLDCKALSLNYEQIEKKILELKPNIIGIGPFTEEIIEAHNVCKIAKKVDKNIITVFGGPHASALPKRSLEEFKELDIVVYGEGEVSFLEIAKIESFNVENLSKINGIVYRDEEKIMLNRCADQIEELDSLPEPAWDLFPLDAYRGILSVNLREETKEKTLELPILSARGCPFNCNFCFKTYKGLRHRDPIKILMRN